MLDRAELAISQWAKERPDLALLPMAVLGRLAEAAQVIAHDHLEPVFERYGLQSGDFDVLATLRRAGAPYALSPTALYNATMVTSGTMTSRLDRLERLGFIARERNPADRRGTVVVLTQQGRETIDEAIVAHVDNQKAILGCLTHPEQETLNRLLTKLVAGLNTTSQQSPV